MSGSGGGGGGGGYTPEYINCASLMFETQLSSPKSAVVAQLNAGDILNVVAQQFGATTVVVVLHNGEVAGGLASPQVQQLRECIANGTEYEARVISVSGGQVRIRVKARGAP